MHRLGWPQAIVKIGRVQRCQDYHRPTPPARSTRAGTCRARRHDNPRTFRARKTDAVPRERMTRPNRGSLRRTAGPLSALTILVSGCSLRLSMSLSGTNPSSEAYFQFAKRETQRRFPL